MKQSRGKKGIWLNIIGALVVVAVLGTLFYGGFLILGGEELLPPKGDAPTPVAVEGQVRAAVYDPFPALEDGADEKSLRESYGLIMESAAKNGLNTVIVQGKKGIEVIWRDHIFPAPKSVSSTDGFLGRVNVDPLAILCEQAAAKGIQVWLSVNPYSASGLSEGMKGRAAFHAGKQGVTESFSAGDSTYNNFLARSLSRIPHKYPVASVVYTGLEQTAGIKDSDAWRAAFGSVLDKVAGEWKQQQYKTTTGLDFDTSGNSLISPEFVDSLVEKQQLKAILPAINNGSSLGSRLEFWGSKGADMIISTPQQDEAAVVLFTAARTDGFAGAVLSALPFDETSPEEIGWLDSTLQDGGGELPKGFDIPHELSVNYPAPGEKIRTQGLFIMGSSDPALPLTIDGRPVEPRGANGSFGVAVELEMGENKFVFAQGETILEYVVTRAEPYKGEGYEPGPDSTKEAEPGQAVQVVTQIASALTDYNNDSKINETFYKGAVFTVQASVQTTRWDSYRKANVKTWAYKLTSGDFVLARNCAWVNNPPAVFGGLAGEQNPEHRGEYLTLFTGATPAAYISYEENNLKLTFYDTTGTAGDVAVPEGISLVQGAKVEQNPDNMVLTLDMSPDFWGYNIEYSEGNTRLFLKNAPVLSQNPARPLEGVQILLDPGHGDTDIGAPGVMGNIGPNEKHLNLALAQATAYRLRQLGAEVTMTREGDSFPTLEDRLGAQMAQKPDFFISLHHNSAEPVQDLNNTKGIHGFYYHPYNRPPSKELAQNLLGGVSNATGRQGGNAGWGYYYVARTTVCPSVLFEYGFVINPMELEDVSSKDGLYAAACGTALGIVNTMPKAGE